MNFGRYDVESTVKILNNKDGLKNKSGTVVDVTSNGWHTVDYNGELYKYRSNQLSLESPSPPEIYQPFVNKPKPRPVIPPNKPKPNMPNRPKMLKRRSPKNRKLDDTEIKRLSQDLANLRTEFETFKKTYTRPEKKDSFLRKMYRKITRSKKKEPTSQPAKIENFPEPVQEEIVSKSPLDILDEISAPPPPKKKPPPPPPPKKKPAPPPPKQTKPAKKKPVSLLDQIQKGKELKKPEPKPAEAAPQAASGGFLYQIKAGKQLKKVESKPKPKQPSKGLTGGLQEALDARRAVLKQDSPDDEEEDSPDWDFGRHKRRFSKHKKKRRLKGKKKKRKSKTRNERSRKKR